jgi:hypothetical protein
MMVVGAAPDVLLRRGRADRDQAIPTPVIVADLPAGERRPTACPTNPRHDDLVRRRVEPVAIEQRHHAVDRHRVLLATPEEDFEDPPLARCHR